MIARFGKSLTISYTKVSNTQFRELKGLSCSGLRVPAVFTDLTISGFGSLSKFIVYVTLLAFDYRLPSSHRK